MNEYIHETISTLNFGKSAGVIKIYMTMNESEDKKEIDQLDAA